MKIGSEGSGARLCLCRPVGLRPTALRTNILVSAIRFVSIVADFNILAVPWAKRTSRKDFSRLLSILSVNASLLLDGQRLFIFSVCLNECGLRLE